MPDQSPYRDGDELTCISDAYPAAMYTWTLDGNADSTASTQALKEGVHLYVCTATITFGGQTCSESYTCTVIAYSKYQKQYNTTVTTMVLMYNNKQHTDLNKWERINSGTENYVLSH